MAPRRSTKRVCSLTISLPACVRSPPDAREAQDPLFDAARAEFGRLKEERLYHMLYLWRLELIRPLSWQITVDGEIFGGNEVDALIAGYGSPLSFEGCGEMKTQWQGQRAAATLLAGSHRRA
jgi:hypothetical protein